VSDKKDREVRRLFSIANTTALEMLSDDDLSSLTPAEIFIGSCKMALESYDPELHRSYSPVAETDRNNVAFFIDQNDAVIIRGDYEFEEALQDLEWGIDWSDDDYED
jgi:hypothetical protein